MNDPRARAIAILLSSKYDSVNGTACVAYVLQPIKKDPNRKGKQFGAVKKVKSSG